MNNFFALFELPVAFDVDKTALKNRYLALQKQHHPDNHGGDDSQSTLINHAFETINRDDKRALYLLDLQGHDINLTESISDLEFLGEMMEIRIDLDDCTSKAELAPLEQSVQTLISAHSDDFRQEFIAQNWTNAKLAAQKLHFLGKLYDDVLSKASEFVSHNDGDDDLYV
ncbi:Fe-S protein assembly co-chaperone HscB [Moraxella caviae]|nr:Fe-S protein assembly co-chaperone HscB [Moraxella caviae]OOR87756.1 Fe-S protein assembly co-chaperone HscB [Moraxella caviae]